MPDNEFEFTPEEVDADALDETPAVTEARLGEIVTYRDSRGYAKAALVVGTQASIQADGPENDGTEAVQDGAVHLTVFGPTGNRYTRHNVPEGDGPNTFSRS